MTTIIAIYLSGALFSFGMARAIDRKAIRFILISTFSSWFGAGAIIGVAIGHNFEK
jgi:hypothetical protein